MKGLRGKHSIQAERTWGQETGAGKVPSECENWERAVRTGV